MSWLREVRDYIGGEPVGQVARPLADVVWEAFAGQVNTEAVLRQEGAALGELLEHQIVQNSVPLLLQSPLENDGVHVDHNRIWVAIVEMEAALLHVFDARAATLLPERVLAGGFNMALFNPRGARRALPRPHPGMPRTRFAHR